MAAASAAADKGASHSHTFVPALSPRSILEMALLFLPILVLYSRFRPLQRSRCPSRYARLQVTLALILKEGYQ